MLQPSSAKPQARSFSSVSPCISWRWSLGCSGVEGGPHAQEGRNRECIGQANSPMGLHRTGVARRESTVLWGALCLPQQSLFCLGTHMLGLSIGSGWAGAACPVRGLRPRQLHRPHRPTPTLTWPRPSAYPNYHPWLGSSVCTNMNNQNEINDNSMWPCFGEHLLMNNLPKRQPTAGRE